jgi:hypothetical protein
MGLIELIVTVCALSLPSQCEELHFSFSAGMSLNQCVMNAQPYNLVSGRSKDPNHDAVMRIGSEDPSGEGQKIAQRDIATALETALDARRQRERQRFDS